jgi:Ca-activated chloride channel family protein
MIELLQPWVLLLLVVPVGVWWLLPAAREVGGAALRVPFYARFASLRSAGRRTGGLRRPWVVCIKSLAFALLVLAAAQPVWMGDPRAIPTRGRDLMLALDISGSMETPDFEVQGQAVDRLSIVRAVAKSFVEKRQGDRMGLVLFGSRAYLQAPLTLDRSTLLQMLDEAELGLAGEETALGDAVGLAVKHLRRRPAEERVLVLLSDGASNAGVLEPLQAAEIAEAEDVRIYTIGLGSGAQMVQTPFGRRLVAADNQVDEATLRTVAQQTGGVYFRAQDTASLLRAHEKIDALERTEGEALSVRPMRALFHWPLAAALAGVALLGVWSLWESLVPGLRGTRVSPSVAGRKPGRRGMQRGRRVAPARAGLELEAMERTLAG